MTWGCRRFLATFSSPSAPREPIPGSWLANKYLHLPSSSKEHSYTRFLHREHVPVILPHPARGAQSHGEDIRAPTPHPWKSRPFLQQGPNAGGATERVTPKSISGGGRSPCPAPRPAPPLSEISSVLFASSHMLPALIEAKYKPSSSCSPKFPFPLCSGLTSPPLALTHLCLEPWARGGAKNAAPGARRCWGAGRDHAHTHSSRRRAGVIRLLFLCHPKRVRGITAAGIKKGLNIFIPKLKEPM